MAWLIERNWRTLADCQSIDPDLFFPVSPDGKPLEQAAVASAVCACCLVRRQCLAFALRTRQALSLTAPGAQVHPGLPLLHRHGLSDRTR